ncbi:MAG: hypothetical protein EXS05_19405 [Planctomycetaceae bacterium]|nr:hypothetical protein [Planctomycetaceae bacterium]
MYAEALLETIDFLSGVTRALPPIASGLGEVPFLKQRLKLIMQGVAPRAMSYPARLAVMLLAAAVLPLRPTFSRATAVIPSPASIAENLPVPAPSESGAPVPETASTFPPSFRPRSGGPTRTADLRVSTVSPDPAASNWATAASVDGRFAIVQQARGSVVLHDGVTGRTTDLSDSQILSVAFAPDGRQFATGGADRTVTIWDAATADIVALFSGHTDAVQVVAFAPDGALLGSGSRNGEVCLWNVATHKLQATMRLEHAPINSLAISPDGQLLAAAAGSWQSIAAGHVTIWNLATLEEQPGFTIDAAVGAVAFHEDRASLVASDWKGQVTIWNLETARTTGVGFVPKDVIAAAPFFVDTPLLSRIVPVAPVAAPVAVPGFDALPRFRLSWDDLIGELPSPATAPAAPPAVRGDCP